jgi:hypothetical protein
MDEITPSSSALTYIACQIRRHKIDLKTAEHVLRYDVFPILWSTALFAPLDGLYPREWLLQCIDKRRQRSQIWQRLTAPYETLYGIAHSGISSRCGTICWWNSRCWRSKKKKNWQKQPKKKRGRNSKEGSSRNFKRAKKMKTFFCSHFLSLVHLEFLNSSQNVSVIVCIIVESQFSCVVFIFSTTVIIYIKSRNLYYKSQTIDISSFYSMDR